MAKKNAQKKKKKAASPALTDAYQTVDVLKKRVLALEQEVEDYAHSFDLYDTAMQALTEVWKQANPDSEALFPDTAALAQWTVARLMGLSDANATLLRENQRLKSEQREMEQRLEYVMTQAGAGS